MCDAGVFDDDSVAGRRADITPAPQQQLVDALCQMNEALARKMAALCDVFVMDAFGTAHRAQASTYGVAEYAPIA